jgi:hypothetical protein
LGFGLFFLMVFDVFLFGANSTTSGYSRRMLLAELLFGLSFLASAESRLATFHASSIFVSCAGSFANLF